MKKEKIKKEYLIYIIIGILIIGAILGLPVILISGLGFVITYGTEYINTKEIIIDLSSYINMGDYLTYYISIVGIEVTSLLSYMLYKTSVKSNELAKAINDKENNRDNEKIRESALIIYYDFVSKISIIKELYSKYILKKDIEINRSIIMIEDWVKNIANLRNILSREELDRLYDLYNRFELIARLQKNNDSKYIEDSVKNICKDIFLNIFLKYLWMDYHGENECLLDYKYYNIFKKIEEKINGKETKQRTYIGDTSDFMVFSGSEIYIDKNEKLIYELKYVNGKIIEGKYFNYINKVRERIFDGKLNDKYNLVMGYITEFDKSMRIKYKGEIKEEEYNGKGILYYRGKIREGKFDGELKDGRKYKGIWTSKGEGEIIYFNGEYRNGIPYTGEIECCKTKCVGDAYGFKGKIKNGKPTDGYGYVKNGVFYDEKYIEEHPECREDDDCNYDEEEYGYNAMYEQLTDEEIQELHENDTRNEKSNDKESYIHHCGEAVELLESKWENGNCIKSEDDLLNKEYFGINIKGK